ncbi:GlxA family transcriptional regulator [Pseudomonas sp. NPDC090202]|uniref:GlxA family transcriptional regulator n=1 Tax=unclassified Pseudomonas TaxID=196821 RepID=UPI00382215DA
MTAHKTFNIGIVPFPGAQLAAIFGLIDLFRIADGFAIRHDGGSSAFLRVSQQLPTGISDVAGQAIHSDARPDVLILPPRLGGPMPAADSEPFVSWLKACHQAGTVIASACGGAFLLAETGLVDGRCMTTHWDHAEIFRQRFPQVRLDIDRLLIDDGDILSAGGLMAWVDLGLKLVDRFLGPTVMAETAHYMLVDPPGREQRYYSTFSPNLSHGDAAVLKVQHGLQASGAKDVNLATLAAMAGLEERTFLRRFRKATGLTAVDYCQRLRVGKACEMLQFSTLTADAIAWQVGYGDASAFRKIFSRITGLTPGEYRRRFSVNRSEDSAR